MFFGLRFISPVLAPLFLRFSLHSGVLQERRKNQARTGLEVYNQKQVLYMYLQFSLNQPQIFIFLNNDVVISLKKANLQKEKSAKTGNLQIKKAENCKFAYQRVCL